MLFIGRAQEKTELFRTETRRDAQGESYPWIVQATGMVNHFYVYCVDADFGPFFLKFCSYFPYNAKLCLLWRRLRHKSHYAFCRVMPASWYCSLRSRVGGGIIRVRRGTRAARRVAGSVLALVPGGVVRARARSLMDMSACM